MPRSTTERSSTASSNDRYDMALDNAPLTQEEEAVISRIEQDCQRTAPAAAAPCQPSRTSPSSSPAPKKRKRGPSASPHLTPSRLRSSVKASARALDAGFKPNTTHSFRQESSSGTVSGDPADAGAVAANADATAQHSGSIGPTRRSESIGPAVPIQQGESGHPLASAIGMGAGDPRRAHSTGPLPIYFDDPARLLGHPSAMGLASGDSRRAQSTGPAPPPMQPSGLGHPGAMGDHSGHYHHYPMPQQYAAYPGQGQSNPHGMPHPYFQAPSSVYGSGAPPQFYHNAHHFHDPKHSRSQMSLPMESPSADVFSPQYAPVADPQRSPRISALQPPLAQPPSVISTRNITPARDLSTARSPTPANTSDPDPMPAALPAVKATKPIPEPAESSSGSMPAIPHILLQPATPIPSLQHDSDNLNRQGGCEDGKSGLKVDTTLEDSPTVGRISNAAREALRKGFGDLDACIKRISAETGLNPAQIVERWDVTKTRVSNSWNIYQGFFEERREQELARLNPEARPKPGAVPNKATISACYDLFRAAKPDTYDDVLRSYHRLRLMEDKGELSISQRNREFQKHADKIDALIRHASGIYGFESICITVGGVVNQDQNLAQVLGTDTTANFFLERLRTSDMVTLGHLKAHVYDRLSKRVAAESGDGLEDDPCSTTAVKKEPALGAVPGDAVVPSINELKDRLIALAARHKITITKGSSLIWKSLPQIVADAGYVILNWPEDVPFPCDDTNKNTSKGISVLKQPARALLFAAFDHATHPLSLEKRYHNSGVPEDHPVIIGVPPEANSAHTHGRRKFLGAHRNEDRQGPRRIQKAPVSQRDVAGIQKPTSHVSKKKESSTRDDSDEDEESKIENLPRPSKRNVATKSKPQVQFVEPDVSEESDTPYRASQDGSPRYSGTEDNMPLARSPHRLRSKRLAKGKTAGKRRVPSKPSAKRSRVSTDEDEEECQSSEASVIEVDSDSPEKSSKPDKKRRVEPAARMNAPPPAGSSPKQSRLGDRNLTDQVAKMLFSDVPAGQALATVRPTSGDHDMTPLPPPTLPAPAAPIPAPPGPTPIPAGPAPHGNQPPPAAAQLHFPHQQAPGHPQISQPPAPRQEGYYYPAPFPESYKTHYVHAERPPSWNLAPGQGPPGWYAPGPGNSLPSGSNLQMSGPGHHAGYWAHQGHPLYNSNPYGQYPPPNMHPNHSPQDETPRACSDGQAGPSV